MRGNETEAQVRARIRAASCPPLLNRPDISLLTFTQFSDSVQPNGAPAPSDPGPQISTRQTDVNRDIQAAQQVLEHYASLQGYMVDQPRPLSSKLDSEMARARMSKGMTAYESILLAGRDAYCKPRETTEVSADKNVDTSQLRTATMIKTHAHMLSEESKKTANASVEKMAIDRFENIELLRKSGFAKISMMQGRLRGLGKIRAGIQDLSENSAGLLDVAGKVHHQFHFVETFLKNEAELHVNRALSLPPISFLCPGHLKVYEARNRRDRMRELVESCNELKTAFKSWSKLSTELYEKMMTTVRPLELQVARLKEEEEQEILAAKVAASEGGRIGMDTQRSVAIMKLSGMIDKMLASYQKSEALRQVRPWHSLWRAAELMHAFLQLALKSFLSSHVSSYGRGNRRLLAFLRWRRCRTSC